jgi:hypothetical protein
MVCVEQGCAGAATAGFAITHDTIKAQEIFDCYLSTRTNNSCSRNNHPGRSSQGGRNIPWGNACQTQEDNDNGLNTAPPPPATQPEDVVAAGKRATSRDKLASLSTPCPSNNYFDKLATDSDDDAEFCFDFADNNPKADSSTYLTLATARHATMQSVSSSLAALVHREFTKMKIALHSDNEVECCADSGATKHMFLDYSTFISYRHVHRQGRHNCQ